MKLEVNDWVWYRNQAYQVDEVGDGQVAISHIDTPGIDVQTVDMAEIEIMTAGEIKIAFDFVRELRWELEQ